MTILFNEGKACDAIIRHIELRESKQRNDVMRPECDNKIPSNKRIDLTCMIGDTLFALEHTGIEPYSYQIELDKQKNDLFGPIEKELTGRLPNTAYFKLLVNYRATKGLKKQYSSIQKALIKWIEETAPNLPTLDGHIPLPIVKVNIPDVPFDVILFRFSLSQPSSAIAGKLMVISGIDNDLEDRREKRIIKACNDKFPKLSEWKKSSVNVRTILVFEENDLSLTNEQLVVKAFLKVEKNMPTRPDEVYLVSTCIETSWWVTCIRNDAKTYYDFELRTWKIDPSKLIDVMACTE